MNIFNKICHTFSPISILGLSGCIFMLVNSFYVDIYKKDETDIFKIKIAELEHKRAGKSGIWILKSIDLPEKYSIDFAVNEDKSKCYIRGRVIEVGDSIEIIIPQKYKNKGDLIPILGLTIIEKNTSFYGKTTLRELNEYNESQISSSKIQLRIACFGIFIILLFMWRFRNMPK